MVQCLFCLVYLARHSHKLSWPGFPKRQLHADLSVLLGVRKRAPWCQKSYAMASANRSPPHNGVARLLVPTAVHLITHPITAIVATQLHAYFLFAMRSMWSSHPLPALHTHTPWKPARTCCEIHLPNRPHVALPSSCRPSMGLQTSTPGPPGHGDFPAFWNGRGSQLRRARATIPPPGLRLRTQDPRSPWTCLYTSLENSPFSDLNTSCSDPLRRSSRSSTGPSRPRHTRQTR